VKEFTIINAADQQFGTVLNNRRVTIRLRYNVSSDRWSLDLSIDDLPVIHGLRVVTGADLLDGFNLGLGRLIALPMQPRVPPDRVNLPNGNVRLYHLTDEEGDALEDLALEIGAAA